MKPSNFNSTFERFRYCAAILRRLHGTQTQFCPICGYRGKFRAYGRQPRYNAQCPRCESLERHRLLFLAFQQRGLLSGSERVLHFAPESCLEKFIRSSSASYRTADFEPGRAEIVLNIEKIDEPDKTVDLVIANHVLEHVDDRAAMREIHRILSDHGRMVISVPIIEAWAKSYDNPSITSLAERVLHFGQQDHLRFFGRDFRDRISDAGFSFEEFIASGQTCVDNGIQRGECIFICSKAL
jgi:SAM-dependent methyltransferase